MALFSVKRTKVVGFSAGVPKNTVYISDVVKNGSYDATDFASKTGI